MQHSILDVRGILYRIYIIYAAYVRLYESSGIKPVEAKVLFSYYTWVQTICLLIIVSKFDCSTQKNTISSSPGKDGKVPAWPGSIRRAPTPGSYTMRFTDKPSHPKHSLGYNNIELTGLFLVIVWALGCCTEWFIQRMHIILLRLYLIFSDPKEPGPGHYQGFIKQKPKKAYTFGVKSVPTYPQILNYVEHCKLLTYLLSIYYIAVRNVNKVLKEKFTVYTVQLCLNYPPIIEVRV